MSRQGLEGPEEVFPTFMEEKALPYTHADDGWSETFQGAMSAAEEADIWRGVLWEIFAIAGALA